MPDLTTGFPHLLFLSANDIIYTEVSKIPKSIKYTNAGLHFGNFAFSHKSFEKSIFDGLFIVEK